ncbi:MAG: hypothetical protein ACRDUT_08700 [Mycobacterium sp.]
MLAGVLAAELVAAAAVIGPGRAAPAQPARPAASAMVGSTSTPRLVVAAGRNVRMINLGGPRSEVLLSRVAANIGTAVDAVDNFWGADWPRDITVVATGSQRQFETEAGGGPAGQWADIAAVAVADRVDPARRIAVRQRIAFAPGAAAMSEPALRIVLSHELFHYAVRADTALDAPRWLTEGVADYVARPATALPEVAPLPTAMPSDADLDAPGPGRSPAYDRAWWFARFVADTRGAATLRALYRAACGFGHTDLATAVHDVLGTDTAAVLAGWRQWLTR